MALCRPTQGCNLILLNRNPRIFTPYYIIARQEASELSEASGVSDRSEPSETSETSEKSDWSERSEGSEGSEFSEASEGSEFSEGSEESEGTECPPKGPREGEAVEFYRNIIIFAV